jgi:hypothetical protein
VFWHLGFDDLNGFGDGFWVGVNGNGGQCQSFACTDISATAPPKKTVLTVDTMENTVSSGTQKPVKRQLIPLRDHGSNSKRSHALTQSVDAVLFHMPLEY